MILTELFTTNIKAFVRLISNYIEAIHYMHVKISVFVLAFIGAFFTVSKRNNKTPIRWAKIISLTFLYYSTFMYWK